MYYTRQWISGMLPALFGAFSSIYSWWRCSWIENGWRRIIPAHWVDERMRVTSLRCPVWGRNIAEISTLWERMKGGGTFSILLKGEGRNVGELFVKLNSKLFCSLIYWYIYIYILAILIWNVIYVLCFSYRLSLLLAIQKYLQIKQSVRDRDTNKYPRRTRQGCYLRIFKQMWLQMELSILNKTSVKN